MGNPVEPPPSPPQFGNIFRFRFTRSYNILSFLVNICTFIIIHNYLLCYKKRIYLKFNLPQLLVKLLPFTSRKKTSKLYKLEAREILTVLHCPSYYFCFFFSEARSHLLLNTKKPAGFNGVVAERHDASRQSKSSTSFPFIFTSASCYGYRLVSSRRGRNYLFCSFT